MTSTPASNAQRVRAGIEASVRQTLREESRHNELRIAYARALLLACYTAIDWLVDLVIEPNTTPNFWIGNSIDTLLFFASAAFAAALSRGWYSEKIRFIVPAVDALLILLLFQLTMYIYSPQQLAAWQLRTVAGLLAAFFILTGSARLDTRVAYLTAVLGVADYIVVTKQLGWTQIDFYGTAILSAVGYVGAWLTQMVRRAAADQVARTTLRRFLPESVIEHAHTDPLELVLEPRSVTVTLIVTDIRGFTSFSESRPPATVFHVLNEIHGAIAEVIHRYGGTIDKFTGDGMLAVFGFPAQTNHALMALDAAEAIGEETHMLNRRLAEEHHLDLQLGIGVHSGAVLVGCIGSDARLEFTVIGDAVNTVFRIQDLTKELKENILVSSETVGLAHPTRHSFRPLRSVQIRGKARSVQLFALALPHA